jgi:hypothetical protein
MDLWRYQESGETKKPPLVVHRRLFNEIMENVNTQISDRSGNFHRLGFELLLNNIVCKSLDKHFPGAAFAALL